MKDFGKIRVGTKKPIALDSPDHLQPYGTKQDNSSNPKFNHKLYELMTTMPVTVLDLGCAGGGMVKSFLDEEHLAVGIEGSDFSKNAQRPEWNTIPEYLFTADITTPFSVQRKIGRKWQPLWFTVVTAWEFMEHIREEDLDVILDNIDQHLLYGGYFICSICDVYQECDLPWHQNIQPWQWWVDRLEKVGLKYNQALTEAFGGDWVRADHHPGVFVKEPIKEITNEEIRSDS
jgi:hypothetical protein